MQKFSVKEMMIDSYESIKLSSDLQFIAAVMHRSKVDNIPVVDKNQKLLGVVTKSTLLKAVSEGKSIKTKAKSLMITDVVSINENIAYEDLTHEIINAKIGVAIITDDKKRVKGVITKSSLITTMIKKEAFASTQLSSIIHTMYNGLITVDSKKRITKINKAGLNTLKKSNGTSLAGVNINELLPGLDLNRVLIIGNTLIGVEYYNNNLSLLCNITPIEENSNITGAVIVFQDLTELIKKVSELESVTKLYETLKLVMDNAYDGIIVVDEMSRISMVNNSSANFFRKNEKQILGKPVEELIKNTKVREVVKTGVPEINQLQFIEGTPYVVTILPVLRKGRVIGAVFKILFRHLEEVKELAEKLNSADQEIAYYKDKIDEKDDDGFGFEQIVTADPYFQKIKEESEIAARGASNILITGESGTGKELVAQAIHYSSPFAKGPLVKINCAAIPENLLESEFFGYAPGAFSGAEKKGKKGKLVSAEGGTLFLDEIGDMSLTLQSKLLRVLQDRKFEPVGSNKTVKVNIRIIAATNQELENLVSEGQFRADLFYRLNVVNFHIPPLRERRYDINLLVHFFLEKYNRIFGSKIKKISGNARDILLNHHWPGNVRELENVIERGMNFALGESIEIESLPLYLREKDSVKTPVKNKTPQFQNEKLKDKKNIYEIEKILSAIEHTGGNKAKAAKMLGISRSWLYEKLSRAGY